MVSMGIYVFNAAFLYEQLIRDADDPHSTRTISARTSFPIWSTLSRICAAFPSSCVGSAGAEPYWRDVGTVDAYWEANMELTKITP